MDDANKQTTPLTVSEAAIRLRCSPQHLYKLCANNEIPHTRLGNKILIPSRVVRALEEGREVE